MMIQVWKWRSWSKTLGYNDDDWDEWVNMGRRGRRTYWVDAMILDPWTNPNNAFIFNPPKVSQHCCTRCKNLFSSKIYVIVCQCCTTSKLCTFSVRCCSGVVWSLETGTVVVAAWLGAGDNPIHFCVTTKWLDLGHQFNHLPTCVHFSPPSRSFSPVKLFENDQIFAIFYPKNKYLSVIVFWQSI